MNRRHWERTPAGLVVVSVIARTEGLYGAYHWSEWPAFYALAGLRVAAVPLPERVSAFLWGRTVYVRHGMSTREIAAAAWHEAGHHLMHAGSCEHWLSRPQGRITVAKFERQARQFANTFPVWGEE